jgi:hypothetical protein
MKLETAYVKTVAGLCGVIALPVHDSTICKPLPTVRLHHCRNGYQRFVWLQENETSTGVIRSAKTPKR